MGKVNRYTGSKLLGEELRRLRGGRSLEDIVEMSKQSPLTSRIHPISAPTLSQIENGVTMPSTEVLYSLSVLYGVSASRLLHHIVEERLATSDKLPATRDEARLGLHAALTAGHWYEALALAIHGGRMAKDESDRLLWQANRAMALRKLGMRQDAVVLLLECAESGQLAKEHRYIAHLYLAEVLAECGYVQTASAHVDRAIASLPQPTPPALMARALSSRVYGTLLVHEFGLGAGEAPLRLALRDTDTIAALQTDTALGPALKLELWRGELYCALGNHLVGEQRYRDVSSKAEVAGLLRVHMAAELALGSSLARRGRKAEAFAHLTRAEHQAVTDGDADAAFDCYFHLASVASAAAGEREAFYWKRCLRYWPLVQARTPRVVAFEELLRSGALR